MRCPVVGRVITSNRLARRRMQRATPLGPARWTNLASVALVEAIEEIQPELQPAIKWPNDILLDDRKVAGILAETTWDGEQLCVVVGVGVNVKTTAAELSSI